MNGVAWTLAAAVAVALILVVILMQEIERLRRREAGQYQLGFDRGYATGFQAGMEYLADTTEAIYLVTDPRAGGGRR